MLEELGRTEEAEEWYGRAEVAADALDSENDDDEVIEVVEEELEPEPEQSEAEQSEPEELKPDGE